MRRSHKKSRRGCFECKRRHIKCDETRPRCINCATVERECDYAPSAAPSGSDDAAQQVSMSPAAGADFSASASASASVVSVTPPPPAPTHTHTHGLARSAGGSPVPSLGPSPAPAPAPVSTPGFTTTPTGTTSPMDVDQHFSTSNPSVSEVAPFAPDVEDQMPTVNMVHMELFYHYLNDTFHAFSPLPEAVREITIRHALREQYLMYQVLALSARHLSVIRGNNTQTPGIPDHFYLEQAIQLQTRSLSLFNTIDMGKSIVGDEMTTTTTTTVTDRVPIFVFSALLGFHALCDVLSYRDDDFSATLARFTGYMRLHRGVYSVMEGHWEALKASELRDVFMVGMKLAQSSGTGPECDDIRRRLLHPSASRELGLDEQAIEHTEKAVGLIQFVFDAGAEAESRAHILLAWATMIQQPFVSMVENGNPVALVVLAYYFCAVHLCRNVWMFRDAGEFLVKSVANYLGGHGGEWASWMEAPLRLLGEINRGRGAGEDGVTGQQHGLAG